MKPLEHISLQCIYCDDIRDELGGKTTIVGWYGAENIQLPPDGPLMLSSLCMVGLIVMPLELSYSSFKVEVMLGDVVFHSINIPPEAFDQLLANGHGSSMGKQIRIAIRTTNLQVSDPCVLRLRIVIDGEEVSGNGLRFTR